MVILVFTVNGNKMAEWTHSVQKCITGLKTVCVNFRRVIAAAIHCMIVQ